MRIDAARWKTVSTLFDQLAELDPTARRKQLAELRLDPPEITWLNQLLAAHDSADPHVLDQTIDRFAANLAGVDPADSSDIAAEFAGRRLGNWRVGDPIGHGAMATVFQAQRADGAYEQHVAIKLLQPGGDQSGNGERLREELRVLARLEHPGIARLIDGGVSDQGFPYLVMEHIDGTHIDQWCAEQDLDWRQRIELLIKVCDAVRYAHGRLIVHADLKPSNVLISRTGQPKLVDFGIAGLLRDDADGVSHDHPALLRCSPAFAAPEQLRGLPVTTATDVFGVGALLYQLLVGTAIRSGQTLTKLLLDSAEPEPVPLPSEHPSPLVPIPRLRGDIDAICRRALDSDPARRYPSIDPLQQDLRNYLNHLPVDARSAGRTYQFSRWLYRHRIGAALGFTLFLSLFVGLTVSIQQTQRANESARKAEAVTDFLLTVFDADQPADYASPLQSTRRDLAVRAAGQLDLVLDQQPEARIELLVAIGRVLRKVGLTDQARTLLQEAIVEIESGTVDGQDSLHVAAWFELGQIESLEERDAQAVEAFRRADDRARTLAPGPVERAAILFQLGRALSISRLFEEALEALEQAASLADASERERELLPRIRLLMALTLNRAGRIDESLAAGELAVAEARRIFGTEHDRTASALSTVGGMLRNGGQLDRAEAMLREAYDIGANHYGQPDAAVANNLATLMSTRGNHVEAEAVQTEALSLAEAYYGPESAPSARYRRNLAMIQMWRSDWPNAIENLRQAVADHERATSPDHSNQLLMEGELAWVQLQAGQTESASAGFQKLDNELPRLSRSHPRSALRIHLLAAELELLNRNAAAAKRHVDKIDALLANDARPVKLLNWERVRFAEVDARVHGALNQKQAARVRWLEALSLSQRLLGDAHPLRVAIEEQVEFDSRRDDNPTSDAMQRRRLR